MFEVQCVHNNYFGAFFQCCGAKFTAEIVNLVLTSPQQLILFNTLSVFLTKAHDYELDFLNLQLTDFYIYIYIHIYYIYINNNLCIHARIFVLDRILWFSISAE